MSARPSQFLTALDASFLYAEKPGQAMHVGSCMLVEGLLGRDDLERVLLERLHLTPRYRQRVLFPPFAVSHPVWVDDPDFEINRHIDVVRLEGEVDDEALSREIARAYSGRLDRSRPLWRAILLQCQEQSRTALLWKVHHSMVDGLALIELGMRLCDFTPEATPPPPSEEPWQAAPLPDPASLFEQGLQHRLEEAATDWREVTTDLLQPVKRRQRAERLRSAARVTLPTLMTPAPPTPFNLPVSGRLGHAWADFSFAEMRKIKGVLGGTVNDLVLTTLSGALGRYLRAHDVDTEGLELRAQCPMSMRPPEQLEQPGNLVSSMIAPLYVGIQDPIERHRVEGEAMRRLKEAGQAEALFDLNRASSRTLPFLQMAAAQLPADRSIFNCVSSNVPGPQIQLYLHGHRVTAWRLLGIISSNIGLFVAILSYNQMISFSATVDAELIPDAWRLAGFLHDSYAELRQAAGVEATPPIEIRSARARSRERGREAPAKA